MNSILNDIPSIPRIPSVTTLNVGITTRVLAKKLAEQRERDKEEDYQYKDDIERRRRSSKFLTGARIPNSVIKSDAFNASNTVKEEERKRQESAEFVDQLIKRLQPKSSRSTNDVFEDGRENLNNIKRQLEKSYDFSSSNDIQRDSKVEPRMLSINPEPQEFDIPYKSEPWRKLQDKRRISRRTSILAPLNGERHPTYESIKKAIDNSKVMQQLLNVDHIEREKMKAIQMDKTFLMSAVSKDTRHMFENIELRANYFESKPSKDRPGSKRRPSSKVDRLHRLTTKKSILKPKTISNKLSK